MNRNIEIINDNLWAVNMQYVEEGYIEELQIIPNAQIGQINLGSDGVIILDKSSKAYLALKQLFQIYMKKSTEELQEILKKPKIDSLDELCENVIGWEIIRRHIRDKNITTGLGITEKIRKWIERKVIKYDSNRHRTE